MRPPSTNRRSLPSELSSTTLARRTPTSVGRATVWPDGNSVSVSEYSATPRMSSLPPPNDATMVRAASGAITRLNGATSRWGRNPGPAAQGDWSTFTVVVTAPLYSVVTKAVGLTATTAIVLAARGSSA